MRKFENITRRVLDVVQISNSHFPEHANALTEINTDFHTQIQRIEAEEQHLSIGIIGQVKAGKSSFLNALLFDGKPILPEAATPKTANLTRITYGDSPRLAVHFYTTDEWAAFRADAESASESERARIARELLQMVAAHDLDTDSVLKQPQTDFSAADINELMAMLNDYVGENGRYTALVKSTEIQLPLPDLKGFEIIDTPGMNDPVHSRTQKTREYMARCDVVFFLSRCSQFMDQADMTLLGEQLPAKGVKRMVLVAGQLDGVIADDGFDRRSLAETENNIRNRLGKRAEVEMERLANTSEQLGQADRAALLRELKKPIFSSTYAQGFACWDKSRWGKGMQHMHQQLTELAEEQWNYQFTKDDWLRLGNFDALNKAFDAARHDKQPLMQARRDDLIPRTRSNLQKALDELQGAAEQRLALLKHTDIQTIEAGVRSTEARMAGIARKLGSTINECLDQARKTAAEVGADLKNEASAAANVQTRTGSKKHVERQTVSTSVWYKPWTWGDTETIERVTFEQYQYIATSDVIERIVNFADESAAQLTREFNKIINMKTLRADLKRALLDELGTASSGFDPQSFRQTLEASLSSLRLPEFSLTLSDQCEKISDKFSGKVRSESKMDELRQMLKSALQSVFIELQAGLESAVRDLTRNLEEVRDGLEEKLTQDLRRELKQLQADFGNKQAEIVQYEALIKLCCQAQADIAA